MLWKIIDSKNLYVEADSFDEAIHVARKINRNYSGAQPSLLDIDRLIILKGATTAPVGYIWYYNGKSRFSDERKTALLKEKR